MAMFDRRKLQENNVNPYPVRRYPSQMPNAQMPPVDLSGAPSYYPDAQRPDMIMPQAPMPPSSMPAREPYVSTEKIQAVMETLLEEKWKDFEKRFDRIEKMKDDIKRPVSGLQNDISKLANKIEFLEKTMSEKVDSYGKNFMDISIELRALHKVFQTILPTFTENIKELRSIVDKARIRQMKSRRKRR
jgi:archaellum component FlaC